jgi:hypothetical protein
LSISSQKYGFGIRDPGPEKTYSGSRIPDPGVKKAPDPGSATLVFFLNFSINLQRADEEPLPAKRSKLDLEPGEENNSGVVDIIDMDNSSEVRNHNRAKKKVIDNNSEVLLTETVSLKEKVRFWSRSLDIA